LFFISPILPGKNGFQLKLGSLLPTPPKKCPLSQKKKNFSFFQPPPRQNFVGILIGLVPGLLFGGFWVKIFPPPFLKGTIGGGEKKKKPNRLEIPKSGRQGDDWEGVSCGFLIFKTLLPHFWGPREGEFLGAPKFFLLGGGAPKKKIYPPKKFFFFFPCLCS